jgi:asparagine synthase (glutamine-hydrolysing)
MCGIAGVFKLSGAITVGDVSAVLEMLDAQFHRGPDDWGLLLPRPALDEPEIKTLLDRVDPTHVSTYPATSSAPGVVLGSRRLAIIDRSFRGRMPMGTEHDERWVVLNGEIYNHRELRAELEGVATFRSHSDSEVLLQGWSRWGDGVAERLRGMFAFALFEALPRPRLVLGRDRLGIKPLYTWGDGVRVVFASEVRALLVSGLVPSEANPEALLRFLELGSVPAPLTTMKDVQPLPEGELAHVDARGMSRVRFWDLGEAVGRARVTRPRSFEEAVTSTRAMLEESMRLHLVSDVPVGAFLSGGVDSASMVALAAPQLERPMTTLTVTFDEAELSEAHYARMVAERYRTDHREVRLQPGAVFDDLPQMFAAMDQPTVDGLNVWCVSRAARDAGLRVVLSGLGGDEVFWGYRHVRFAPALEAVCRIMSSLPPSTRRTLVRAVARGAPVLRAGLDRAAYLEDPSALSAYFLVRGLFTPGQASRLLGLSSTEFANAPVRLPYAGSDGMREALTTYDITHYLGNQLLRDGDVMSMAHSVEMRVPYLDHPLVERVMSLPARYKLAKERPKPLLLSALDGRIPRGVWDRRKMGFTLPMARWMRAREPELRTICHESKQLDARAVDLVWNGFLRGRHHWSRPWAVYVLSQFEAGLKRNASRAR